MQLVIRADGGSEIGYGHLTRSNALAEEFLSRGHSVTYASTTPSSVREVCAKDVDIVSLASRQDSNQFTDWINNAQPDAVITDSYAAGTAYQRDIRDHSPLAVIQDDARHAVCADIFINGNLYADELDYEFCNSRPQTYFGADYILLRSAIRSFAACEPTWRDTPEQALVTMGGSDITNVTPTVLQAFDGFDISVDTIIGPGFSAKQEREIQAVATTVSADIELVCNPDNLAKRMFDSDFAITTASTTTYELLTLGTPIISCATVDNQKLIAEALRQRDLASVIESTGSTQEVRQLIYKYVSDPTVRRERSKRGRNIVDSDGASRIADIITATVES